jgi:prepilin-type N-terminal cleavage/methylation domain-containing protein/prepilin-type processing-associated H-X9-DG protein
MQTKKGFTLIELLVVIAIIAILAAILFPVFANARDKARQISDLSNIKQIALATTMYVQDFDDTYPVGDIFYNGGTPFNWVEEIFPYLGTTNVLFGTDDSAAGSASEFNYTTGGKQISYGVNALDGYGPSNFWGCLGVFSWDASWDGPGYWNIKPQKVASVTQPTASIMFCDLQSSDVSKDLPGQDKGISSEYPDVSCLGALYNYDPKQNTTYTNDPRECGDAAKACTGTYGFGGWQANWMLPNPLRNPTNAYPYGPNGLVSAPFSSGTLTNFAFVDGHAKAMKPAATNPDGAINASYTSYDQNNMWVAIR